ncbi:serine protease inhibitor Kazal-type 1-like [Hippocampus comes]|uniref:serine protease inhibitor Kazal-type 1-like n=1 Tax=Hippocampus comes TaxID=109280 RepID=UPI00094E818A|nr:PREDICTED: serine protease inhibitor Kazal-type 1-like [Hippocampus comes]
MAGNVLLVGLLLFCVIADTEALPKRPSCSITHERIICREIYSPVCGTDQNTYSNECSLCQHNQETRAAVWIAYNGECSAVQQHGM